ncbi:hypothetical protein D3C87_1181080 [compost metagenome]
MRKDRCNRNRFTLNAQVTLNVAILEWSFTIAMSKTLWVTWNELFRHLAVFNQARR